MDHLCLIVHEFDSGSDPDVFPLAILLPPSGHHHAEQHPADTEAQVACQVYGVEEEHGSAKVNQELHQHAIDSGGVQLLRAAEGRETIREPRSLRRPARIHLSGGFHWVGLPLEPGSS